jgi:hypothetical protein
VLAPFSFDPAHPYAAGEHRGIDIAASEGETVLAPAAGTVTFAGTVPGSGRVVTITTADGLAVTLTHLGSIVATASTTVGEGDVIGMVGPSGDPEVGDPYVHLGVRVASDPQGYRDPVAYLPVRAPAPPAPAPAPPAAPAPAPPPVATAQAQVVDSSPPATPVAPAADPVSADGPVPAVVAAPAAATRVTGLRVAATVTHVRSATSPPAAATGIESVLRDHAALSVGASRHDTVAPEAHSVPMTARTPDAPREDVRAADAAARPATVADRPSVPVTPAAAPAAASPRVVPSGVSRRGSPSIPGWWPAAIGLLGVLLGAVGFVRTRRPIMVGHALLRDNADLLRQRPPAHRSLLHDDCGGHPRAAPAAARRGDILLDRRRRARDQGLARRRAARAVRAGVRRSDRRDLESAP